MLDSGCHHGSDLFVVAHAGLDRQSANAECLRFGCSFEGFGGRRVVVDHDVGASASERFTPDGASFPTGIRLIKEGDVFSGDWGEGTTWSGDPVTKDGATSTPPIELELSDPYYLGIAVTSHAAGTLTEAVVDVINDTPMAVDPNGKLATTWGAIRDVR